MPLQQGLAGAKFGQHFILGHHLSVPVVAGCPPLSLNGVENMPLEALEAAGKRAYRPGRGV